MSMKLATALNYVSQAVGNTKIGHVDTIEAINQAGRHMCSMHPWEWLLGATATLDITATFSSIALPPSIKAIESLTFTSGFVRDMRESSMAEIELMRSKLPTGPVYMTLWAVVSKPGVTGTFPYLEIYPTPTVTEAAGLRISYSSKWTEMNASDQTGTQTPDWIDGLLAQFIMSFARGFQRAQSSAEFMADLAAIERGPLALAAMKHDAELKSCMGPIRNPAVRRDYDRSAWWLSSPAAPPV